MRKRNIVSVFAAVLFIIFGVIIYQYWRGSILSENMDPKTWDKTTATILPVAWQEKQWVSKKSQKQKIIDVPYISGTVQTSEVFGDDSKGECAYNIFFDLDSKTKRDILYTITHSVKEQFLADGWAVTHDGESEYRDGSGKFYYLEVTKIGEDGEENIRIDVSTYTDKDFLFFGYYLPPCSTGPQL